MKISSQKEEKAGSVVPDSKFLLTDIKERIIITSKNFIQRFGASLHRFLGFESEIR